MMVSIIGEVQKPGEFRVHDQTNLLELLAKAGGPTQYSRLESVSLRRLPGRRPFEAPAGQLTTRVEILWVNIDEILRDNNVTPPVLQPGDVVFVPRSANRYRDITTVIRDVAVVVSLYFLYLNATRN
jgi:protein involved in polysaccharide export with SLBB domain